eukprot:3822831-Amphidinium_carterae.1
MHEMNFARQHKTATRQKNSMKATEYTSMTLSICTKLDHSTTLITLATLCIESLGFSRHTEATDRVYTWLRTLAQATWADITDIGKLSVGFGGVLSGHNRDKARASCSHKQQDSQIVVLRMSANSSSRCGVFDSEGCKQDELEAWMANKPSKLLGWFQQAFPPMRREDVTFAILTLRQEMISAACGGTWIWGNAWKQP